MNLNTQFLHGNFKCEDKTGATLAPIYQSSAFGKSSAEEIEKIFNNELPGFAYSRISNPTTFAFEQRIAYIEKGISSTATSSGMSAISMTFLNIVQSGDEIISTTSIFGGTLDLWSDLKKIKITVKFVDEITEENLSKVVSSKTKAVFAETIGNPKLNVTDIKKAADAAHKFNLPFILDNTAATPYLVTAIPLGADIVINSTSKYINGHSNSIGGIITDGGKFDWNNGNYPSLEKYKKYGKLVFSAALKNDTLRNYGACISPQNSFLNSIGLETLGLRMERHCENALRLAQCMENKPGIHSVNYPLLDTNPWHDIAKKQFGGKGGGIFTMRLYTKHRAFEFIDRLKYAIIITNIGDTKTLVVHPSSTIYAHSDNRTKEKAGVYDDMIRISVGIEDIDDLISDFTDALEYVNTKYGNEVSE
ncbi:MAG: PLP-dependent transferase [Firmicutes bacterium]|nr:PLP-dependent transferase [Bacillota bacterium]